MQIKFVVFIFSTGGDDVYKRVVKSPSFGILDGNGILLDGQTVIDGKSAVDETCGNVIEYGVSITGINPVEI